MLSASWGSTFVHSRLVHFAVALTALVWIFEFIPVPPPTDREAPFTTIYKKALQAISRTPSYLGFWNVYQPTGDFYPLVPSGEHIREEAAKASHYIRHLQNRTFFRIFKVDLNQECPFWARQDLCSDGSSCTVCECSDDEIPRRWKEKPTEHFVSRSVEGADYTPWDETSKNNLFGETGEAENKFLDTLTGGPQTASYVDLVANPPGFTAYKGRNIWQLIYKENCIRNSTTEVFNLKDPSYVPACSDEDIYERIISGLQTTIMVLASEYNAPYRGNRWLPLLSAPSRTAQEAQHSERYKFNLDLFRWRVNVNPSWVDNLYIDFSLLLRTIGRLHPIISNCGCYTGTDADDQATSELLNSFVDFVTHDTQSGTPKYTNMPIFTRKQDQAIQQLHNVSRIFDCIECEKCRLHGKVKLTALQVAVKSLPAPGYQRITSLERNEITALINALGYFTDAIRIITVMHHRVLALRRIILTIALWTLVGVIQMIRKTWPRKIAPKTVGQPSEPKRTRGLKKQR